MDFSRRFQPDSGTSAFLFGPRMTGKTTLLRSMRCAAFFDLLDPVLELELKANPRLFHEQVEALPAGSLVIIDEVQRAPLLLDYVQIGIDRNRHVFLLSGSSARKLKRGAANLLGGRALDLRLHPLTADEFPGTLFEIGKALHFGTLPKIADLVVSGREDLALAHLKSYITTYLKEEIQAEALTRNLGAFNRFLNVAAQMNGQVIEYQNVSRDCTVPASTVKEYYQVLEDTLTGRYLWQHGQGERKKARPKFHFFDCGVVRAIQNRLGDPPTPVERGLLFETWLVNEIGRLRDYLGKEHAFSFWREREAEIDLVISDGHGPLLAIECKSGKADVKPSVLARFRERFPGVRLIIASLIDDRPRRAGGVEILPWRETLSLYAGL